MNSVGYSERELHLIAPRATAPPDDTNVPSMIQAAMADSIDEAARAANVDVAAVEAQLATIVDDLPQAAAATGFKPTSAEKWGTYIKTAVVAGLLLGGGGAAVSLTGANPFASNGRISTATQKGVVAAVAKEATTVSANSSIPYSQALEQVLAPVYQHGTYHPGVLAMQKIIEKPVSVKDLQKLEAMAFSSSQDNWQLTDLPKEATPLKEIEVVGVAAPKTKRGTKNPSTALARMGPTALTRLPGAVETVVGPGGDARDLGPIEVVGEVAPRGNLIKEAIQPLPKDTALRLPLSGKDAHPRRPPSGPKSGPRSKGVRHLKPANVSSSKPAPRGTPAVERMVQEGGIQPSEGEVAPRANLIKEVIQPLPKDTALRLPLSGKDAHPRRPPSGPKSGPRSKGVRHLKPANVSSSKPAPRGTPAVERMVQEGGIQPSSPAERRTAADPFGGIKLPSLKGIRWPSPRLPGFMRRSPIVKTPEGIQPLPKDTALRLPLSAKDAKAIRPPAGPKDVPARTKARVGTKRGEKDTAPSFAGLLAGAGLAAAALGAEYGAPAALELARDRLGRRRTKRAGGTKRTAAIAPGSAASASAEGFSRREACELQCTRPNGTIDRACVRRCMAGRRS